MTAENNPHFEDIPPEYLTHMSAVAGGLNQMLAPNGFCLIVFDIENPGRVNLVANVGREHSLAAMRAYVEQFDAGQRNEETDIPFPYKPDAKPDTNA